jgi:hypothetical protein
MGNVTKKLSIILLILAGFVVGSWLAWQNYKLVELLHPEKTAKQIPEQTSDRFTKITIGMDTWQVKEVLGPPDERNVITGSEEEQKEAWRYGTKRLFFTNGFLTRLQE